MSVIDVIVAVDVDGVVFVVAVADDVVVDVNVVVAAAVAHEKR